jgi:uncharacterized Zn-finger protein
VSPHRRFIRPTLAAAGAGAGRLLKPGAMQTDRFTPEISYVATPRVACDGACETHPALGHPRVYLQIDEKGYVDCGYCDKRFVLRGGPADQAGAGA